MRHCSIDKSLCGDFKAKKIIKLIDPALANVKCEIIKNRLVGDALDRDTLERSHILFLTMPNKKMTYDNYINLIDYIDVGGTLILTLPSPQSWFGLGRWFNRFIEELGISFESNFVYGLPSIPLNIRLFIFDLKIHRAHIIRYNEDEAFMKEHGIKEYIPIALMDDEPVLVMGNKRRGRFIISSSKEIFSESNYLFLNYLLRIASKREDFTIGEINKVRIGNSNFYIALNHGCARYFLLSLFHFKYNFYKQPVVFETKEKLVSLILKLIEDQKHVAEMVSKENVELAIKRVNLDEM